MDEEKKRHQGGPGGLIDANLKKVYEELVSEELPDRFKDLLAKLKQQDSDKEEDNDV